MNYQDYNEIITIESKPERIAVSSAAMDDILTFMAEAGNCIGMLKKIMFTGKPIDPHRLRSASIALRDSLEHLSVVLSTAEPGKDLDGEGHAGYFVGTDVNKRLLHAVMGSFDESGELANALKLQGTTGELDAVNFKEELGDKRWYDEIAYDELGTTIEAIQALNYAKLLDKNRGRYKDGFSFAASENRDVDAERALMQEHEAKLRVV